MKDVLYLHDLLYWKLAAYYEPSYTSRSSDYLLCTYNV
jgi:hypothetical protein